MAAITNDTATTQVTEIIPAEAIHQQVGVFAHDIPVAISLSGLFMPSGSNVYRLTQLESFANVLTEASGKTETDEIAAIELTAAESTLTGATVAARIALSMEAQLYAAPGIDPKQGAVFALLTAMMQQLESDLLGRITGATNTTDYSGNDLTLDRWLVGLHGLRANKGPGEKINFVGNLEQTKDIQASALNHGGAVMGSSWGAAQADSGLMNANRRGYIGTFMGVDIYESSQVPQYDASNWSGAFIKTSAQPIHCGLALGRWTPVHLTVSDGGNDNANLRLATDLVAWGVYGTAINRNDCLEEVVTSKT